MFNKIVSFFSISFLALILTSCGGNYKNVLLDDDVTEVAVMLPLSGQHEQTGEKMLKLVKQGLEDAKQTNIRPVIYDTATEISVKDAMQDIVNRNIKIIIGPLFSKTASQILSKVKQHDIFMLTLSNNPALAGDTVYVFGHAPIKQTERLINYYLTMGYKNFFVLLPTGGHSYNVGKIIQNMVVKKDATLVRSEYYSDYQESINHAVKNISDAVDILNEDDTVTKKPVIYIGDYAEILPTLYNKFYKYSLDSKAEIIGDSRINIDYDKPVSLTYTGSLNIEDTDLQQKFTRLIGSDHIAYLEGISYDLALVAANSIGKEFSKKKFKAKLDDASGYMGITGVVRFNENVAERKYDVIRKVGTEHRVLDYASDVFE